MAVQQQDFQSSMSSPMGDKYLSLIGDHIDKDIELGLDFILFHFDNQEFLFPRKISTYKSNNKQFLVRNREEVINAFIASNFIDCRINAYPYLTDYKGIQRYKPNFIFIDLDKNNFKSERSFKVALSTTLKNIKDKLLDSNAQPTVLETGGGYHIYQPLYFPTALENVIQFSGFDRPSEQFLRFTKDYLSNGKADKQNNPSFKSCLLRIPGSINSKYVNTKVKIIQKWNGYRPPILREFVESFRSYLIQKKIDEQAKQRQKILNMRRNKNRDNNSIYNINYYYDWIDKTILANPFPDYRKIILDLILAPYLINIKKLPYEESYQIIREWLDRCNAIRKLDNYSNFLNYRIHSALRTAVNKGIGPMSLYKIKTDSRYKNNLYLLILQKGGKI